MFIRHHADTKMILPLTKACADAPCQAEKKAREGNPREREQKLRVSMSTGAEMSCLQLRSCEVYRQVRFKPDGTLIPLETDHKNTDFCPSASNTRELNSGPLIAPTTPGGNLL